MQAPIVVQVPGDKHWHVSRSTTALLSPVSQSSMFAISQWDDGVCSKIGPSSGVGLIWGHVHATEWAELAWHLLSSDIIIYMTHPKIQRFCMSGIP